MRVEIRSRPYDLYTVMVASVILMLVLIITPDITALRVILGLPFILFFPGYALISALYPERQKILSGEDGSDITGTSTSSEDADAENKAVQTKYQRRQARRRRKEEKDRGETDIGEDEQDRIRTKGLDGLERVALSLGLSIAITPLIGLILNFTYDWDPQNLGLRLIPIFASQFLFIMITSGAAVWRRLHVPLHDRFGITIDASMPDDYSGMDKVLSVGIVLMMIISVSLLIYIIVVPREGESFTELYVLGNSGKADDYPRYFQYSREQFFTIGVGNHEHRDMNYTLVVMIADGAGNDTVASFDDIELSPDLNPSMEIFVEDGETLEIPTNFSIEEIGSYKVRINLFIDGEEYNSVHIWVKVFEEGTLGSVGSSEDISYLAGLDGDPGSMLVPVNEDYMGISINYRRSTEGDMDVTVRLNITEVSSFADPSLFAVSDGEDAVYFPGGNLTEAEGLVIRMRVNVTELNHPLLISVPPGDWYLTVTVISPSGVLSHRTAVSWGET